MQLFNRKIISAVAIASVVSVSFGMPAYAHVTVKPAQVATSSYSTFTVSVPNEKSIPTVEVKLDIPPGVTGVTPTAKAEWDIAVEKEGRGDNTRVTSVTWSDGEIANDLRDEFTFGAKTPDQDGEIQWKAYQTYADGTTVAWDQLESNNGHEEASTSGPFSITTVSTAVESGDEHSHQDAATSAHDESSAGRWGIYVSAAALAVSFGALFVALRKK
ncbi:MAG: hypothetical protein UY35_C0010G0011 [Candidatus Saccharibacteria bacterium GW2011_GWC2_48_9]|nr:MAG: hypothetical protein UY35_C0010G0011 [Candidatus Saccharibacteria bacterium GW2011_GWC2_48_9]HCH34015.1 hypothetical protein [Candidatus Saccharibacteria bacterium]